jgi:16S rRNA (guanine527-N7)-methyltransferase
MTATTGVGAKLDAYSALVTAWAPRLDLIAPRDLGRFRQRHIDDCLRLAPLLEGVPAGPAVDVGSGAGLPGIVLAIAGPERTWRLLEPRGKRAAFLEEVARTLDLGAVEILPLSAQQAAADPGLRRAHLLAVARAVASPKQSFALLRPLVAAGGTAAVFAGKTAEIPPGAKEWQRGIFVSSEASGREGRL